MVEKVPEKGRNWAGRGQDRIRAKTKRAGARTGLKVDRNLFWKLPRTDQDHSFLKSFTERFKARGGDGEVKTCF